MSEMPNMTVATADFIRWSEKQNRYIVKGELTIDRDVTFSEYMMIAEGNRMLGQSVVAQSSEFAETSLIPKLHKVG